MSATDTLGKILGLILEPVAPLLSLVFVLTLIWRRMSAYWIVAVYFLIATVHGAFEHYKRIDSIPPAYITFATVELLLLAVIAWELARRSFVSYPSLAAFATRALWIVVPVCVILALLTYLFDPPLDPARSPALQLTLAIERSIRTIILVFLLAVSVFAGWFPVRMKQNSARLLIGFMTLLAWRWIALYAENMRWQWAGWGNVWTVFVTAEVLLYWVVALRPAGEVVVASTVTRWDPERMEALTGQLEEIHTQLARRGY